MRVAVSLQGRRAGAELPVVPGLALRPGGALAALLAERDAALAQVVAPLAPVAVLVALALHLNALLNRVALEAWKEREKQILQFSHLKKIDTSQSKLLPHSFFILGN